MSYNCKSADDVLKVIKDDKIEMVDLPSRICLASGSIFLCRRTHSVPTVSPMVSGSTGRRSAAFRKSRKATCWSFLIQ